MNKIFDDIFSTDHSERAVAFKNNIKSAIASYKTNPASTAHIRFLNSQYWDMVYFIVKKRILTTGDLQFSENEKLAIDFGYISDELSAEENAINPENLKESVLSREPEKKRPLLCFSISLWLYEQLQDYLGINKIKEYEKKYEALINSVNSLRDEKKIVIESKNKLDKDFQENPPRGINKSEIEKLINYNLKIDGALEKYGLLRSRIQNELLLRKEERVEFVNLENIINNTRDERKKFFKSLIWLDSDYLSKIIFLEDMIIQKEHEIFDNVTLIGKSRQKIEEFIYSKKEILEEEKDIFLKDRISAIKNIIDLISKNSKIEPVIFLTQALHKNIPDVLYDLMEKALKHDPGLFENKKTKIYGRPDIILVPGKGRGDYDYHMNAFIIPHFPSTDYNDSLLNALAYYRWQCDDENRIKNSFAFLKSNKYFTNASSLMQAFIKNYCLYMSKSISGENINELNNFDCETIFWFNNVISRKENETPADGKTENSIIKIITENDSINIMSEQKVDNIKFQTKIPDEDNYKINKTEDTMEDKTEDTTKNIEAIETKIENHTESIKKIIKLPGEFDIQSEQNNPAEGKPIEELKTINEKIKTNEAHIKKEPAVSQKNKRLPGEFIDEISETAETIENTDNNINEHSDSNKANLEKYARTELKESQAVKEVNETISMLLKENSAIIKKKIQSIFKFEKIQVEPAEEHQKVNIKLYNLDAGQVKHFLNLMSLQSKYYKFMSSIIKEEEI